MFLFMSEELYYLGAHLCDVAAAGVLLSGAPVWRSCLVLLSGAAGSGARRSCLVLLVLVLLVLLLVLLVLLLVLLLLLLVLLLLVVLLLSVAPGAAAVPLGCCWCRLLLILGTM